MNTTHFWIGKPASTTFHLSISYRKIVAKAGAVYCVDAINARKDNQPMITEKELIILFLDIRNFTDFLQLGSQSESVNRKILTGNVYQGSYQFWRNSG